MYNLIFLWEFLNFKFKAPFLLGCMMEPIFLHWITVFLNFIWFIKDCFEMINIRISYIWTTGWRNAETFIAVSFPFRWTSRDELKVTRREEGVGDPFCSLRFFATPLVNPLRLKSDHHQISPYNINALYNRVVIRITIMITQDEFAWYFINFSPLLL